MFDFQHGTQAKFMITSTSIWYMKKHITLTTPCFETSVLARLKYANAAISPQLVAQATNATEL